MNWSRAVGRRRYLDAVQELRALYRSLRNRSVLRQCLGHGVTTTDEALLHRWKSEEVGKERATRIYSRRGGGVLR